MKDKVTYEYAIIRLVPKVEREEFINIGVLLFSKSKDYIGLKYLIDPIRINALYPEIDLDLLENYLSAWKSIAEGNENGGKIGQMDKSFRFRWMASKRSTILQTSKVHPGLCNDPEKLLQELFDKYVLI